MNSNNIYNISTSAMATSAAYTTTIFNKLMRSTTLPESTKTMITRKAIKSIKYIGCFGVLTGLTVAAGVYAYSKLNARVSTTDAANELDEREIQQGTEFRDIGEFLDDNEQVVARIEPAPTVRQRHQAAQDEEHPGFPQRRYRGRLTQPRPVTYFLYTMAKARFGEQEETAANRAMIRDYMFEWYRTRKEDYKDLRDRDFREARDQAVALYFIPDRLEIRASEIRYSEEAIELYFLRSNPTQWQKIVYALNKDLWVHWYHRPGGGRQ